MKNSLADLGNKLLRNGFSVLTERFLREKRQTCLRRRGGLKILDENVRKIRYMPRHIILIIDSFLKASRLLKKPFTTLGGTTFRPNL
jgi:hypothetical protein